MSRIPLTPDRIFTTALALADTSGLEALTMRRLGEALGVEAMSLYNHVANKERLVDALVDVVFAEIALPPEGLPWREAMRLRTVSAHEVLRRHRWAPPLMESRTQPGPATLTHHNAVLRCFRQGGFSVAQAAHAISLIDAHLFGFSLQQNALPFQTEAEVASVAAALLEHFPVQQFPYLAEMMTDHALLPGYDYDGEFAFGLEVILEGLERRFAAPVPFSP